MAKKSKGPKRIAGVKVPKRLRKPLGRAGALIQNPVFAELIAAALMAAAAAIRDSKNVHKAARAAKHSADDAVHEIGSGAASLATVIAARARQAAQAIEESHAGANGSDGSGAGSRGAGKRKSGRKPGKKG